MGLENIRIVLVHPRHGGNVGSVCRAMKNMGLSRLTVVSDGHLLDMTEAAKMAYRAADLLESRRTVSSLADAVADCGLVAGTTARLGLYRAHARTPRQWAPRLLEASASTNVALVFGREDKGLSNEDLALCTQIVRIPSAPEYPSLNLSHAVMICCYELYVAADVFALEAEPSPEAPSELRERMFAMWERVLLDMGFMEPEKAPHMMLGLRRILSRGKLTENDVRILMGIAHQSQWYVDRMKGRNRRKT